MRIQADSLDLTGGFGQQARFLGALQMQHCRQHTFAAAQMTADRRILQHAHGGQQAHVLEGAAHPKPLAICAN
jgi:hypothetical protein